MNNIFGYIIESNLLIKNNEIEYDIAIKKAMIAIKKKINLNNLPKNIKIQKKEWIFGGMKKIKIWIEA